MTRVIENAEFKKHIAKYCKIAEKETVVITVKGDARFVIIGVNEYNNLIGYGVKK